MPVPLAQAIEKSGLDLIGTVPNDAAMAEFEFSGRPLVELPANTAVYKAIQEIAQKML
jgi:CO dehydrogenase maturation factor